MSTETSTPTSSTETTSSSTTSEVETQNSDIQAETTHEVENHTSEEVGEEEIETAPEDSQLDELTQAERLNVNEMIIKQLRGEQFSKADIAKLEKAGLSTDQIATLADAHKQVQLKNNQEIYEAVGGEAVYEGLKEFAAEHLEDSEAEAINMALGSGNMRLAKMAVLGLKALAEQVNGKAPNKRVDGSGTITGSSEGAYETQQELIKDLNNRKYGKDPEFTALVDARRSKSGF